MAIPPAVVFHVHKSPPTAYAARGVSPYQGNRCANAHGWQALPACGAEAPAPRQSQQAAPFIGPDVHSFFITFNRKVKRQGAKRIHFYGFKWLNHDQT